MTNKIEDLMKPIDLKKFRRWAGQFDSTCPFCRDGIEMYCTHGCPACGNTGRIEPIRPAEAGEAAG